MLCAILTATMRASYSTLVHLIILIMSGAVQIMNVLLCNCIHSVVTFLLLCQYNILSTQFRRALKCLFKFRYMWNIKQLNLWSYTAPLINIGRMFISISLEKPIALIKGVVKPEYKSLFSFSRSLLIFRKNLLSPSSCPNLPSLRKRSFSKPTHLFNLLIPVLPPLLQFSIHLLFYSFYCLL
jgi:hypothetical protein